MTTEITNGAAMPAVASGAVGQPWRDPSRTSGERADALIDEMTLEEKVGQLVGLWVGADASGGGVAPNQGDMTGDDLGWTEVIDGGLGQLTRPFGTAPVDPAAGARSLASSQREIMAANRFGIPAQVHEECLAGFAAWRATAYPIPLSWGATFDPDLVAEMATQIGASMRAVGVHQGLAPVLDVTRDYRWGRTEETIAEDPQLVGEIGAAYVRGLESAGIVATLKHFAGYSASRAGRNLAPVSIGPREFADVILPPFEVALREGGARSVMHSYTEIDGVPSAADGRLLTGLLREEWGFEGTVVADYFGVRFLEKLHRVAGGPGEAAGLALRAGVDVELPSVDAFGAPLLEAVRGGLVDVALVDRALHRVLRQKIDLGLLDPGYSPEPVGVRADGVDGGILDTAASKEVALRLAREAVVLLSNPGTTLPFAPGARVAVVGPLADEEMAMLGCYSFPAHVGVQHPEHPIGLDIPTVRAALTDAGLEVTHARGCDVTDPDPSGLDEAARVAAAADVAVVAVGDRAGLFGRGTSGEGCDAEDLHLPGIQADLVEAVLATGTPVVLVLLSGRPYALGAYAGRAAAIVQTFFPGQLGGRAIAEVLTGTVAPSGRLPVSVPRNPTGGPGTYLTAPLGGRSGVSNLDPTALFGFGHGLTYTSFEWSAARVAGTAGESADWDVAGEVTVEVTVRNTGDRAGTEVVQLYLHDPVAQVTRPVQRLIGFARVPLESGEAALVRFTVPADLTSFTGLTGRRIVEPGAVELRLARSSTDIEAALPLRLTGTERETGPDRALRCAVVIEAAHQPAEVTQ
ncbi:glycosyl hydrolase [Occultella glacieicola]|uniref:Glycosyl hydrolase n=1 Tax=Occultella glacieicola TaxID=2518684 RepID=A0ABY2DYJ9_9MICO|nr:glycoside hydrolase family 3 N-terminal domain-containing protein [Occultella glacieicola]TDE88841.1 glycosyl hydrolase [Occultella glacieicola]